MPALLCLLCGWSAVRGAEPEYLSGIDDRWRHYQSPHFELYSRNDDGESRELLHNLELLHTVVLERLKGAERAKLDVTVYFFRRREDFRAYAPENFAKSDFFRGFYMSGPTRAVISVAPIDNWEDAQRIIFHEYVHHLFRVLEQDPPVWFNEGMAEVLAGIRVEHDQLEIGRPQLSRVAVLREEKLLPLETLFAVDHGSPIYNSENHAGLFYAESWALLHYWYFGQSGLKPEAVERFVRVASQRELAAKVNLRAYFRECFAMDYPEMQRRLDDYATSGSYRFGRQPVPKIPAAASYVARDVPRDELRVRLAELGLRANGSTDAKIALLAEAKRTSPDPRALEALGADAFLAREETQARDRWEQALAAGSHNTAMLRELALLECREWFADFNYDFRLPEAAAQKFRARLGQSLQFEPLQTAPYEMFAWVEAYAENPSLVNANIVQKHFAELKHRDRTAVALALLHVHLGDNPGALKVLDQLDGLAPDSWSLQAAEQIRARLEDRLPNRINTGSDQLPQRVAGGEQARAKIVEGATATKVRVPSVVLPPRPASK